MRLKFKTIIVLQIFKNTVLLIGCFLTVMIGKATVIGGESNVSTAGCNNPDQDVRPIGKLINCITDSGSPGVMCIQEVKVGQDCYMEGIRCHDYNP